MAAESITATKACTKCKAIKPVSDFYPSKTLKSGYRSRCKACELEGGAEKAKAWYEANKERAAEARKRWARENKERVRDVRRLYVSREKERIAEIKRRYKERNRDRINERARELYRLNPTPRRDARKRYDAKNPHVRRTITRNRRALRQDVYGRLKADIEGRLLQRQRWKCVACGGCLRKMKFEIDHIVPIARGGTNEESNLQALCVGCNRAKSSKDPIDFMQQRGFLL